MIDSLTIALAQTNPTVGDVAQNAGRIRAQADEAAALNADLAVFGELCLSGYPPEDLVFKESFVKSIEAHVMELARETVGKRPALLIGAPWIVQGKLHNAALLIDEGKVATVVPKHVLPNYGVFDEKRVFARAPLPDPAPFRGIQLGVMICEDMWTPAVTSHLAALGADILLVLNGSPFEEDKVGVRLKQAGRRTRAANLPLAYVNLVGGQDELVFDGGSFVLDNGGKVSVQAPFWDESVTPTRWVRSDNGAWKPQAAPLAKAAGHLELTYRAAAKGLEDYVCKNRFNGVLIGLSGGIDSALSAAIAVDALGPDKVYCVMMPSRYTSEESLEDAAKTAKLLGVRLDTISIESAMNAFADMLLAAFAGTKSGIAEENIQARLRGVTLMALSNKFGHMVLSTGNKSEMSIGYTTLYGDMCGGYSVLKDIYKTTVFELTRWRNHCRPAGLRGPKGEAVPERVIAKPPSAELRPNQTDQDSLPPYADLDSILRHIIEDDMSQDEIVRRGHSLDMVRRVWRMVDLAEYKRRQAPPGVKVSSRCLGRDRRYPITNGFKG